MLLPFWFSFKEAKKCKYFLIQKNVCVDFIFNPPLHQIRLVTIVPQVGANFHLLSQ